MRFPSQSKTVQAFMIPPPFSDLSQAHACIVGIVLVRLCDSDGVDAGMTVMLAAGNGS